MKLDSYKNLIVWQKSIDLVEKIYLLADQFPKSEIYGLSSQIQRAAVSIPSNIAEGQQRNNLKEYIQFLSIASGSVAELETQIIIAKRIYSKFDYFQVNSLIIEIQKMLNVLIRKLKDRNLKPLTLNLKPDSGQVMLLTVLVLSGTILSATTIAGLLTLYQIRQATDFANSAKAIYAADTGIEWRLYKFMKEDARVCKDCPDGGACPQPEMSNISRPAAAIKTNCGAVIQGVSTTTVIKSTGVSGNVSRAFEFVFE